MALAYRADLGKFRRRIDRAGRIVRRREKNRPSSRSDGGLDLGDDGMEAVLRRRSNTLDPPSRGSDCASIGDIHRFGNKNLVTRVDKTERCGKERVLRSQR